MERIRQLVRFIGLATLYYIAGWLCLTLAFAYPSATPVWAPTGIALAAFLILGRSIWPAIFLGAFFVNLATQGTIWTSLGIATGNTLEGVIGAALVTRFAGGLAVFTRGRTTALFVVLVAGLATTVSASVGVLSLWLGGYAVPDALGEMWMTWWLGDASGALLVTPFLLLWASPPRPIIEPTRLPETVGLVLAVLVSGAVVFGEFDAVSFSRSPAEFIAMPVLMWAAFRFGPRAASAAVVAFAVLAITGTLQGNGPFAWTSLNNSLLLLQGFLAVAAATTMVVAAAMAERREAEAQLRLWSIQDPLTGLANHRKLIAVLEAEIERYKRTERGFALLLLDLDELKSINDRRGHLVGSRALCRLGAVLKRSSRAIDTVARYGGDEFAVVLPESDVREAQFLADRVKVRLAEDLEPPAITASSGSAACPGDGDTVEGLISAADRQLYAAKRRRSAGIKTGDVGDQGSSLLQG